MSLTTPIPAHTVFLATRISASGANPQAAAALVGVSVAILRLWSWIRR